MSNIMNNKLEIIQRKVWELIDYMKKDSNFQLFLKEKLENKTYEEIINENLNISRFAIPVIGKISSGKSTFLNALLGTQTLETNSCITTQFFCIIRHNPETTVPKLFSLEIDKKNQEIYFKKKECVAEGEKKIKNYVSKINKEMNEIKKKKIKEDNINEFGKFFYLLELKISLFEFNENLQQFHPFFEFIDIPGLNEMENYYLENLIPLIKNYVKFCIFIFDSEKTESNDTFQVVMDVKKYFDLKFGNSLLVCNKMDLIKEENKENLISKFNSLLLPKIGLSPDRNKAFFIDSINFLRDMNKPLEFQHYISFLYSNYKELQEHKKSFLKYYGENVKDTIKDQVSLQDWRNYTEKKTEEDNKYVTEIYNKIRTDAINSDLWDNIGFDLTESREDHINILVDEYHRFNYFKKKLKWSKPKLFTELSSYFFKTFQLLFSQYQNDLIDKIVSLIENNKRKYENLLNQEVKKNEELTNCLAIFQKRAKELIAFESIIENNEIQEVDELKDIEYFTNFVNILIENYLDEAANNKLIKNEINYIKKKIENCQSNEQFNDIVENANCHEFIQKMLIAIKKFREISNLDNSKSEKFNKKKEMYLKQTLILNLSIEDQLDFEKKRNQMLDILEKIKMVKEQNDY